MVSRRSRCVTGVALIAVIIIVIVIVGQHSKAPTVPVTAAASSSLDCTAPRTAEQSPEPSVQEFGPERTRDSLEGRQAEQIERAANSLIAAKTEPPTRAVRATATLNQPMALQDARRFAEQSGLSIDLLVMGYPGSDSYYTFEQPLVIAPGGPPLTDADVMSDHTERVRRIRQGAEDLAAQLPAQQSLNTVDVQVAIDTTRSDVAKMLRAIEDLSSPRIIALKGTISVADALMVSESDSSYLVESLALIDSVCFWNDPVIADEAIDAFVRAQERHASGGLPNESSGGL